MRLALCLLLLCASFPLMARDVRMMGANGDNGGGCQDDSVAHGDDTPLRPATAKRSTHAAKPIKAKPGVSRSSDNLGDVRPPRWHSFLPGMFR